MTEKTVIHEAQAKGLVQHELGFWYLKDKPTPEALSAFYAQKYYQLRVGTRKDQRTRSELSFLQAKIAQRQAMVEQVCDFGDAVPSMLDVGCGEGFVLSHFKKLGWQVKGIDFSRAGIERQNPECLDNFQDGDVYQLLDQEIASGRTYHVVWLQNVLEHVLEPLSLLKTLKKLVAKGGCAVITVPNDFSDLQSEVLQQNKVSRPYWVALPDHLTYFDAKSLINAAEFCGWQQKTMTADFPIDWFLFNSESNYIEDPCKGKPVHEARVQIENLIHQQPMAQQLNFWQSLAQIGMGRNITAYLSPNDCEKDHP